jgi:hypothetical protein
VRQGRIGASPFASRFAWAQGVLESSYVALSARSAAFAMHWIISSRSRSASVMVTRDGSLSWATHWLASP